jgi:flavin-dependent dehydrogenase
VALQDAYECRCDLEPGIFHFFARPEISPYLSAYVKDERLIVDVAVSIGLRATEVMDRFKTFLWPRVGVEKASLAGRLGCRVTYAAPKGLFCFGTHRVLVAGEASGLLNNFGEGISSALASGLIAGRAAGRGLREGVPPGRIYREEIEGEKRKTIDTFDYRRFLFGKSSAFHFGARSVPRSWRERIGLGGDVVRWLWRMKKAG